MVSIIIPTYNRKHLISETLDSILNQTYKNWECLIIDDNSTDETEAFLNKNYLQDKRFKFFVRPASMLKGANSCRNIGLDEAQGDFIVFFDSDDIMTPDHLHVKVEGIVKHQCDYVITKTRFFNSDATNLHNNYKFDEYAITPYNYISQKLNWLTYDVCIKKDLAKSIRFNENLQSGQEYNYFSKLVYKSTEGIFLNTVVTLRRKHDDSIRGRLNNKSILNLSFFKAYWFTYLDVKSVSDSNTKQYLLNQCIIRIYEERQILAKNKGLFCLEVIRILGVNSINFFMMILSLKLFGKGYYFRNKLVS